MASTVRIDWSREFDNKQMWNDVCAWAIDKFGLPGERFTTQANVNYMEFIFPCEKDALMMSLRWNAKIIDDQQQTLDFVGRIVNGF